MTTGPGRSMRELIESGEKSFSFEFFPPKDAAGEERLWRAITELEPYRPTFVSVTYGAGGSSRDTTVRITGRIAQETSLLPVAHLTCVGHSRAELIEILDAYRDAGVAHILALRGDPPGGPHTEWVSAEDGLEYASELVAFIKEHYDAAVGVAAFPEGHVNAESVEHDAQVLKAKHDAGAEFAVTEMVLRASDYFALVDRARAIGVDIPIIPGIMPILNLNSMSRMVELSGREMPPEVTARIEPLAETPAELRAEGIRISTELCQELLSGGAPGLHFYTLNFSKATREIFTALQITV
ncbi:MAG: 5,10-methylenetetrahydrofolate reductase [Nocardioides sp.]|uniref:methylenetetrahydrofolate reductase [NAD(P)H] n=1 Tax=Nocardioides sp. TaxID=35761 RepID=UPI002614DA38|nr:methylenetetrahydrofolate reductase [NAD(P)H] [Nocardioides sp.]MCW2833082.1 5,10-methylenetetrahydrofolate reductase [Nocardioides sp.]